MTEDENKALFDLIQTNSLENYLLTIQIADLSYVQTQYLKQWKLKRKMKFIRYDGCKTSIQRKELGKVPTYKYVQEFTFKFGIIHKLFFKRTWNHKRKKLENSKLEYIFAHSPNHKQNDYGWHFQFETKTSKKGTITSYIQWILKDLNKNTHKYPSQKLIL